MEEEEEQTSRGVRHGGQVGGGSGINGIGTGDGDRGTRGREVVSTG